MYFSFFCTKFKTFQQRWNKAIIHARNCLGRRQHIFSRVAADQLAIFPAPINKSYDNETLWAILGCMGDRNNVIGTDLKENHFQNHPTLLVLLLDSHSTKSSCIYTNRVATYKGTMTVCITLAAQTYLWKVRVDSGPWSFFQQQCWLLKITTNLKQKFAVYLRGGLP